jgi:membrane protease YdiL (CAAX protease family)
MPVLGSLSERFLLAIEFGLVGLGFLILVTAVANWWGKGHRDPLRGSPIRLNRLTPLWLWICVVGQLGCWMIAGLLATGGARVGTDAEESPQTSVLAGNLAQVLTAIMCLVVARMTFVQGWRGLGIGRKPIRNDLAWAVAGWLVSTGLCWVIYLVTVHLWTLLRPDFVPPEHTVLTALRESTTSAFIRVLAFGGALILAPISEELFFRGIIQTGIRKLLFARPGSYWHRWLAIVITAIVFGAMHISTPQQVPALVALAIILGYVYERTGSLGGPILLHMLFNGKTLLLWVTLQP